VGTRLRSAPAAGGLTLLLLFGGGALAESSGGPKTLRVDVSSSGAQAKSFREGPRLSADGRFVVFSSKASNLVRHDTNHASDVFVRDLKTEKTQRVSVSSSGRQANRASYFPSISSTGRYVTFLSYATNLAGWDRLGHHDVYLRDRKLHKTIRVSVSSSGRQGTGSHSYRAPVSADGRVVAFVSWSHLAPEDGHSRNPDVFVRNLKTRRTELVSVTLGGGHGDRYSLSPSISDDGRFVAFTSSSKNLAPQDRGHGWDVFVRDLATHTTTMASVDSNGQPGPALFDSRGGEISADGRFVAFSSWAPFAADDTNRAFDVYLRDLRDGTTQRVSLTSSGTELPNREHSWVGGVSAHGAFVAFQSGAPGVVPGEDPPIGDSGYVRDVVNHTTTRVTVNTAGQPANIGIPPPPWTSGVIPTSTLAISADGRFAGFASDSTNLVRHDTNGWSDLFVRGPLRP
jgi:Tol biopolymer transport system component